MKGYSTGIISEVDYEIGKIVWIAGISPGLTQETIVHRFKLIAHGDCGKWNYVVAVETAIEPELRVRSWGAISETPDGPLNFRYLVLGRGKDVC